MSADPRNTLRLDGVASTELEGIERAERYGAVEALACSVAVLPIRRGPDPGAERLDELLFGEGFDVLARRGAFAFGQARRDGYVGWVEASGLRAEVEAPTHRVVVLRAPVFARADLKSPLEAMLSLNALVSAGRVEGRFTEVPGTGFVPSQHLTPVGAGFEGDPATVAERFLGAPYLWGGRSSLGLDCSGLVQQALYACGRACPRDTDQQRALGGEAPSDALARNDLVFWKGHVGIMLDGERLLHANAHHMATAAEPLVQARARIAAAGGGEPTAFRRL